MKYFRVLKNVTIAGKPYKTTIGYKADMAHAEVVKSLQMQNLIEMSDKPFLFANGKLLNPKKIEKVEPVIEKPAVEDVVVSEMENTTETIGENIVEEESVVVDDTNTFRPKKKKRY